MSASGSNQGLRAGVCLSTTRPAAPYDGQMIYETDTNLVRIWNGSAWKTLSYSDYTSGSVIQVASATKTDTFSTTSTSFTDVTGLSVSITPVSTSSKVLVIATISGISTNNADGGSSGYVIVRGSTIIAQNTSLSQDLAGQLSNRFIGSTAFTVNHATTFLDSPATTSATTYKIQVQTQGSNTLYINRDVDGVVGSVSSITVMEIAG